MDIHDQGSFGVRQLRVIDVGASTGEFSKYVSDLHVAHIVAVEPLKDVAARIPRRTNIKTVVTAIRNVDDPTIGVMHRTEFSELSSFIAPNQKADPSLWGAHLDLVGTIERETVQVQSLYHLLNDLKWQTVDFIKIDAQGLDLEVLQSAGPRLDDISAAVLEVPYLKNSSLYANETSLMEAIEWGHDFGFLTIRVVPNGAGEANLFFANKLHGIKHYFEIERTLELASCPTLKLKNMETSRFKEMYMDSRQLFARSATLKNAYRALVKLQK